MGRRLVGPVHIEDGTDTTKRVTVDTSAATTATTATIATAQTTNRTYTVPDSGASTSFVMVAGNQTITGTKTFKTSFKIEDTDGSNSVTITVPNLSADYSLTLPSDDGTSNNQVLTTDGSGILSWQSMLPAGIMMDFGGTSVPTGWLETDGTAVNRTTYANLFAAIGVTWGVGDGSTTFNLPDLSRRVTVGRGGVGTATLGNAVGNTGGAETLPAHDHGTGTLVNSTSAVTGTAAADGDHNHGGTTGTTSVDHLHSYPASAEGGGSGGNGASNNAYGSTTASSGNGYILNAPTDGGSAGFISSSAASSGTNHNHSISLSGTHTHTVSGTAAAQTISGNTASTGTGTHGVIQPSAVVMKIIKT